MTGTYAIEYDDAKGVLMREYHVDCHPEFFAKYTNNHHSRLYGGNLSVCLPPASRPKVLIGQDECIIKENLFSAKQWNGSEGQCIIRPKDDGHAWMLSSFILQLWSFDVGKMLTCNKLAEINLRRKNQQYISKESAIEINQTADKPKLKDSSPFCQFFEYGANKDGYWNYHHAALQLEDVVDCLTCLFPDVDFFCLIKAVDTVNARKMV